MSKFPNSTKLVIGSETDTETYPEFPNATLQTSDFAGRTVQKIDFSTANLIFGGIKAIDYFGDGSSYLLNTPGVSVPSSTVSSSTFRAICRHSRDGAFDMLSRAQQLFAVSDLPDLFYTDPVTARISLEKLATFDADPNIFVVVAHDISLRETISYFPAYLNDWKKSGLKEQTVWSFIDKANPAYVRE
ncbi:hypothetical protein C8R45DRAFT_967045 [Mycena sanguinolenta]|nr:hypothetical protein C8R45DRAFT_967045 [Mycena sanguinolenta]